MAFTVLYTQKKKALAQLKEFEFVAENCRRSVEGEPVLETKMTQIRRKLGKYFPPLRPHPRSPSSTTYERMFDHGTRENDILRMCMTVAICETVGMLFYGALALKYAVFPSRMAVWVSVVVQVVMGLMIASPNIRAVVLLAIPKLITMKLRAILILFILSWSFQIPAMNTAKNLEMLADSLGCVKESVVTASNDIIEKTNEQTGKFSMERSKKELRSFSKSSFEFAKKVRDLQTSLEGYSQMMKDYMHGVLSVKIRCQRFFVGPYYYCISIFEDVYNGCDEKEMDANSLRCKAVRMLRKVCEIARFTQEVCALPEKVKESLKHGYESIANAQTRGGIQKLQTALKVAVAVANETKNIGETVQEDLAFNVNYSTTFNASNSIDFRRVRQDLHKYVDSYASTIRYLNKIISVAIILIIISPFLSAMKYAIKYNRGESVNNCHITDEFRTVDLLREARGLPIILPLMPKERNKYVDGVSLSMTSSEHTRVLVGFVMTIIVAIVPVIIIGIDVLTYRVVYFSYAFFQSNLTRSDHVDHYAMTVSGEGMAADLLAQLLAIYNPVTDRVSSDTKWRECFLEPTPPDMMLFQVLFLLFIVCLVICVLQVYVIRLRRHIAAHYWPERARPRALFLYNEIIQGRKNVLEQMLKVAKSRELEEKLADDELAGRGHIITRGLPIMNEDKYECVRCGRLDLGVSNSSNSRICPCCSSLYCTDCYSVTRICLDCKGALQMVMRNVEFYCDSSEDDDEKAEQRGSNASEQSSSNRDTVKRKRGHESGLKPSANIAS